MESSKFNALLFISMLFISSVTPILGCGSCGTPPTKHKPKGPTVKPPITLPPPPVTLPPIVKPPITVPPVTVPPIKPPVTLPPIVKPPITIPPVTVPPIKPPVTLPPVTVPIPPVTVPPVTVPPVLNPPSGKACPPPPATAATCPIDTLKLGPCVDLLGGLVHIGDPAANECCPVLAGLMGSEAAVCLCTTLKIKGLNLNMFVPIALQLLITCGKTPPPGYTCSV
ncbi:bifunctional inhibitor/lipid-transfer protein/seed storage 2S albumin superfamily protein [Actinidia rufa]|uniref:Bifunctional inhibitor/lipid-transfer protein/seed storage 2S albumin superfamily protein n=1 Tax=Actinidia rufa TaxID=165716 RepID=A0A7J0DT23_9ERIC|nr:bifunctional inhibitor/lipid-transfer protein/seed storage 2S albumin superfamily protein [Actinidia rufa]